MESVFTYFISPVQTADGDISSAIPDLGTRTNYESLSGQSRRAYG